MKKVYVIAMLYVSSIIFGMQNSGNPLEKSCPIDIRHFVGRSNSSGSLSSQERRNSPAKNAPAIMRVQRQSSLNSIGSIDGTIIPSKSSLENSK